MFVVKTPEDSKFEFEVDGRVYRVTSLKNMPYKEIAEFDKSIEPLGTLERRNKTLEFILSLFEKDAPGVIDSLTAEQVSNLVKAYQEFSAISVGE